MFMLLALMFAFSPFNLFAQSVWGPENHYNKLYDITTVESVTGLVLAIDKIYPENNLSYGIHLTLNTTEGNVSVHLGPGWFIENQDIQINSNDYVTVTGSKITVNGVDIIVAKNVMKDDKILVLREENGYPLWSGWRSR